MGLISRKPLERRTIVQVIRHRHPRIVDQDVESIDGIESRLDLSPVSHIEHHGHDAPVRICERLSRSGVDALCTSAERLVDERLPEAAIGACHQDGLACESCGSDTFVLRLNRFALMLVETPWLSKTDRSVWRQAGVSWSDASWYAIVGR